MKWAGKSPDELADIYWEEIAPEFAADGHDPETEYPSYEWLVAHGYGGFRYPFCGMTTRENSPGDMSLAEFFQQYLDLSNSAAHQWPGEHQETHDELNRFLTEMSENGVCDDTIDNYRYAFSSLLNTHYEEYGHVDILSVVSKEAISTTNHWRSVLTRLDTEIETRSVYKYTKILERFYDFYISGEDDNPISALVERYRRQRDVQSEPESLSPDQVVAMYDGATSRDERLVILLVAAGDVTTQDCASMRTDAIRVENDDAFRISLADNHDCLIPAPMGAESIQKRIDSDEYLFPSSQSTRSHVTPETIRRWFGKAARRANITLNGDVPTPRDARGVLRKSAIPQEWGFGETHEGGGDDE